MRAERRSMAESHVHGAFDGFEAKLMKLLEEHSTSLDLRELARVNELLAEARAWALDAVR